MKKQVARILVVDDEPHVCDLLMRWLTADGHSCAPAFNGETALRLLQSHEFHLVISDIMMPGISGMDLLRTIKMRFPKIAVLMVTAVDDRKTGILALELGAYGYIIKPFDRNEILINVASALERRETSLLARQYELNLAEHAHRHDLEMRHREEIILRMISASGRGHGETGGHLRRVGSYASALAKTVASGWTLRALEDIEVAAALHDAGKVGISHRILHKTGKLTPEEFDVMKTHTLIGQRILGDSDAPLLRMARDIAFSHHERWDGSGYPQGLAGKAIPETARIVAVVEVYDALINKRLYRPAFTEDEALSMMIQQSGKQFDPRTLDAFISILPEIRDIRDEIERAELGSQNPPAILNR
ncbi:MAG: response regulator [Desulfomonile tiedjei]|nr:response regulator [Desulfomonile tiedjei]